MSGGTEESLDGEEAVLDVSESTAGGDGVKVSVGTEGVGTTVMLGRVGVGGGITREDVSKLVVRRVPRSEAGGQIKEGAAGEMDARLSAGIGGLVTEVTASRRDCCLSEGVALGRKGLEERNMGQGSGRIELPLGFVQSNASERGRWLGG